MERIVLIFLGIARIAFTSYLGKVFTDIKNKLLTEKIDLDYCF